MTLTRNEKKYCENGEVGEGNGGRGEVLGGSLFDPEAYMSAHLSGVTREHCPRALAFGALPSSVFRVRT